MVFVLFVLSANLFEDAAFREALLRISGWWVGLVAALTNGTL